MTKTTTATKVTRMVTAANKKTLIFQDVIKEQQNGNSNSSDDADEALSLAFFELANVPLVGYRLQASQQRRHRNGESKVITVEQDTTACGNHTGGIVWETSYLLINYLLQKQEKLGRVLEVGAGCGLLGQVLAASGWCKRVILTETEEVLVNLKANLERNTTMLSPKKNKKGSKIAAQQLDWLAYEKDTIDNLKKHSFDTIVGTDVVFTPSLVEPLLSTLAFMAATDKAVVYLCLQVRCEDSHQLLLKKAGDHGWKLRNISSKLANIPECVWGLQMECHLLELTRDNQNTNDAVGIGKVKKRKASSTSSHNDSMSSSKKKK